MRTTRHFDALNVGTDAPSTQRAIGGISGMLDDIGFAKTADTGQLVISSLTTLTAAYGPYEIRSFTDSIGTVVMKIEFGKNGSTGSRPLFRTTFGSGSDGAGNITGVFPNMNQVVWGDPASFTPAAYQQFACLSNGTFTMSLHGLMSVANHSVYFVFDRQRNPDTGAQVAGGHMIYARAQGAGQLAVVGNTAYQNSYSALSTYAQANVGYVEAASGMYGSTPLTFEIMPILGAWPRPAIQPGAVFFWGPEIPVGATFNLEVYGQVRTYLSVSRGNAYSGLGMAGGSANIGMAVLYE